MWSGQQWGKQEVKQGAISNSIADLCFSNMMNLEMCHFITSCQQMSSLAWIFMILIFHFVLVIFHFKCHWWIHRVWGMCVHLNLCHDFMTVVFASSLSYTHSSLPGDVSRTTQVLLHMLIWGQIMLSSTSERIKNYNMAITVVIAQVRGTTFA